MRRGDGGVFRMLLRTLYAAAPAFLRCAPLTDALEAIARYGWTGVFDAVVCMEDAAVKPDPAPVRLALSQLRDAHVRRALAADVAAVRAQAEAAAEELIRPERTAMVGDTVDDIRAAVAAGVVGGSSAVCCNRPTDVQEMRGSSSLNANALIIDSSGH